MGFVVCEVEHRCFFVSKTISSEVSSDSHECFLQRSLNSIELSAENGVRPILPWSAAGTKPDPITAKDVSLDLTFCEAFRVIQEISWFKAFIEATI